MTPIKEQNARITATTLGVEDHGILTCYIHVEGDGWGCGFGGYALDHPIFADAEHREFLRREGSAYGMEFIRRVLEVLDVERWEQLPGTYVRVKSTGLGGGLVAIGHPIRERWFNPKLDLAYMLEDKS